MSASGNSVLSVRVDPTERALLEAAAAQERTTLSDFVRRMAVTAAETTLFHRNLVTIPAEQWQAFEGWVAAPPADNPGLAEIGERKPAWER